jgi:hypothetical protein
MNRAIISEILPPEARQWLIAAAASGDAKTIDAAIVSVVTTYPAFFRVEAQREHFVLAILREHAHSSARSGCACARASRPDLFPNTAVFENVWSRVQHTRRGLDRR